jgi:hypothetical protein
VRIASRLPPSWCFAARTGRHPTASQSDFPETTFSYAAPTRIDTVGQPRACDPRRGLPGHPKRALGPGVATAVAPVYGATRFERMAAPVFAGRTAAVGQPAWESVMPFSTSVLGSRTAPSAGAPARNSMPCSRTGRGGPPGAARKPPGDRSLFRARQRWPIRAITKLEPSSRLCCTGRPCLIST